jgi:AraC-like DNA-binding protein
MLLQANDRLSHIEHGGLPVSVMNPKSAHKRTSLRAPVIATVLTPLERIRVDVAAADGAFEVVHRNSMEELNQDVRIQQVDAVIVSVARYDIASTARMATMVREFPTVPAFALLTDVQRSTPHSVLELGRVGVRTLIDARSPNGWTALRDLLTRENSSDVQRQMLGALNIDLAGAAPDCWSFFELLFTHKPYIVNVRQISRYMNVIPGTLMSRFYRAHLPSPKRYIDVGRLVRAARLFENTGLSVTNVARKLDYSSPQAFSRHVRCVLGMSPVRFRALYDGDAMLSKFREELVLPYLPVLRSFKPAAAQPGWMPKSA